MSILLSSIGIALILLVKKVLKNHISARWQYNLGLLFFILLVIPFIPGSVFASLNIGSGFNGIQLAETTALVVNEATAPTYPTNWLQDFAVQVYRSQEGHLALVLVAMWIVGVIASAVIAWLNSRNLRLIKESAKPIEDKKILDLFMRCKAEVGVKGNVLLGASVLVKTPMTIGLFKTIILLPAAEISLTDMRHVLLHELVHCKNRDIQISGLMCLFQMLYWFNPLVYLAFKQMRLDRELACDAYVLDMLPAEAHISYGKTLLNFASTWWQPTIFAADIGGSKPQIVRRIKAITSHTTDTSLQKLKSICVFALMGILIFVQIPILAVFANSSDTDKFDFQAENVLYSDLSHFFDGIEGSFVLYDLDTGVYTIHNRDVSTTRVSPNSTYKIFSALIALQTGVLQADNSFMAWDGENHPFEAWNQDQNLATAMRYSVNWYFQNFDRQVGLESLYYYLASYGNSNLSGGIADFWIESSLRISPVEQVQLLTDFYRNDTVFETRHVNAVKDVLQLQENNGAVLSGKTGTGFVNGIVANGWFIGYVENSGRTFVFATYIQSLGDGNAGGSVAAGITLSILEYKGIF